MQYSDSDYIEEFTVEEFDNNMRIDAVISNRFSEYTRSRIQKMIADCNVAVNGITGISKNYKCKLGDLISVEITPPEEVNIVPENIPLDIIFEDNDIIIVNKPKGMVVHPAPGHYTGTMVNALMYHCGDKLSGINGELRPGIVHRIDKDTSGILAVCKNDFSHNYMADLLSRHDINRTYYCLVYGILKEKSGTVNQPIGRHQTDRKKMCINTKNGRNAITHYKVINEYQNKYSLLECKLETGRTHQIRVHLSSIHHPLVGDVVYGRDKHPFKTDGQMLHAAKLGFVHPTMGVYVEFSSKLPEYFEAICRKLGSGNDEILDSLQNSL